MRKLKFIGFIIFFIAIANTSLAQNFTQTIRGRVLDKTSQQPLPGANVIVVGSSPLVGVITDFDGYYELKNVAIGRITLSFSFLGYLAQTLSNQELTTGKELILDIELEEMVIKTEEIVVRASKNKMQVNNTMTTLSARTFTIEESRKFAGARNDVSRMATNYAGVNAGDDAVNDIVIRGNSPLGLLWRLEGIEIPNPNHFGNIGGTGGPVSMLNNNVLRNSDFFTGAFPAEYGNAMSGAFDLKMRNGNYSKHEFLGQVGFNGFELGAEGPISRKNRSSYLINVRYSTLGFMKDIGVNFGVTAVPNYQDLSFKFNFPTAKAGTFSVFGLGGLNNIEFLRSEMTQEELEEDGMYGYELMDIDSRNGTGIIGFSHTYHLGENTFVKTVLAATHIRNNNDVDSVTPRLIDPNSHEHVTLPLHRQIYKENKMSASIAFNTKISAKHSIRYGAIVDYIYFNSVDSSYFAQYDSFYKGLDHDGGTTMSKASCNGNSDRQIN